MTVPAKIPADTHVGNGVTTQFAYSFLCFDKVDFKVFIDLVLVDPSEYTVDGLGNPSGGMVTFTTPPANGVSVILRLDVVLDRQTNYQYEGDFLSPVVNRDFDRLWLSQQSQQVDLNAAVRFPPGESVSFLPAVGTRKGKALVFDPITGDPTTSIDDYEDQAANAAISAQAAANSAQLAGESAFNASASETNAHQYAVDAGNFAASVDPNNLSTDYYGPTAPAIIWPGMTWADSGTNTLWRRNAANDGWADEGILFHRALPQFTSLPAVNKGDIHIDGAGPHTFNPGTSAYAPIIPGRPILVKTYDGPALIKTSANTLSVRAGTYVSVAGQYIPFLVDTAITMPALTAGEDYSVWVKPDGTAVAVADPYSAPAAAPVSGAVKIGGFHYGLVAPGTTVASGGFSTGPVTGSGGSFAWTQADVDRIAGINEFSIWDLGWRCAGEQRGMTFEPLYREWWAIYFMSTDGDTNGPGRSNTDVASGTVLPFVPRAWGGDGVVKYAALNGWTAQEMVSRFGLHLPLYDRFQAAAFGVTEGQSLGGASSTIPATAHQPKFTSHIGLEQATGHAWAIGAPTNAVGGSAYSGNGRGSWYGSYGLPLFGGSRSYAAKSGSRSAVFNSALSISGWNYSVRAAGDHLNLGRTAR